MDDEYERNVEKVMAYLDARARSRETVRGHRECLSQLAEHLDERSLPYSEQTAWEWFNEVGPGLGETSRNIWAGALGKIADLYDTGEIRPSHHRAPKMEDRLNERHALVVDDYCAHLRDSGLAQATVRNHRAAAVRFLLSLQDGGVGFVADASYADVIGILLACEERTYCSRTDYRGKIRSILAWMHSVGLARFGFTLLVDAMALKKGYCWNGVAPRTVEELRRSQSRGVASVALDGYLRLVEDLADELLGHGYSRTAVSVASHFGKLLYLFMDANGLRYDPRVGRAWVESMRPSLSYHDFMGCRRTVMLLEQSHEGVAHDLRRAFSSRGTLRDRLPGWCLPQVDAFLDMKGAEGWKRSTLTMFRTCVCRFCLFLDDIGLTAFDQLAAEHVKRFNAEDPHDTPEGKNAFNSRIRQFLEWLGRTGELSNPHLHLALANASARREELVVALTEAEQRELEDALDGDGSSLRDKAMLQMGLRMGIRACDVVGLPASGINWGDATMRLVQAKTGYEVDLPMPADVGNALYRYIVAERPESAEDSVFLRGKAPFAPLGADAARRSLAKALPRRDVPGSGFHALRKTFATNMLRGGAEPAKVAEALGHRGVDNVRKYLHLDGDRMRICGLSLEESGLEPKGGLFDGR